MRPALVLCLLVSCGATQTPARSATVQLRCRDQLVTVEVAADEATRERGLMHRRTLPPDTGMLFVFPSPQIASFWMKDTPLPLSIAFIDESGRIDSVRDMAPFDDQTFHKSEGYVRYALEMTQGWFEGHGVGRGDTCDLRPVQSR